MMDDKAPPIPFVDRRNEPNEEVFSSINRVTYRITMVRERGGEEYQIFPPSAWSGLEIPIENHRDAAFILPDLILNDQVRRLDFGWVSAPRVVAVLNKTRWKGVTNPTPEQSNKIARSVVMLGFDSERFPLRIAPGETQPLLISSSVLYVFVKAEAESPVISVFAV